MAFFSAAISLLLLLLSLTISSPSVHGSLPSDVECSGEIVLNMASCLPFLTIWSKMDKPEGFCCSGVKKLLDTNPDCLCERLKNSGSLPLGFVFNVTKASSLPALCNLTAPLTTACGLPTTTTTTPTPPASAPAPAPPAGSGSGSRQGSVSFLAPSTSENNHGSSLIPISGLSFVISGALVLLFSRI